MQSGSSLKTRPWKPWEDVSADDGHQPRGFLKKDDTMINPLPLQNRDMLHSVPLVLGNRMEPHRRGWFAQKTLPVPLVFLGLRGLATAGLSRGPWGEHGMEMPWFSALSSQGPDGYRRRERPLQSGAAGSSIQSGTPVQSGPTVQNAHDDATPAVQIGRNRRPHAGASPGGEVDGSSQTGSVLKSPMGTFIFQQLGSGRSLPGHGRSSHPPSGTFYDATKGANYKKTCFTTPNKGEATAPYSLGKPLGASASSWAQTEQSAEKTRVVKERTVRTPDSMTEQILRNDRDSRDEWNYLPDKKPEMGVPAPPGIFSGAAPPATHGRIGTSNFPTGNKTVFNEGKGLSDHTIPHGSPSLTNELRYRSTGISRRDKGSRFGKRESEERQHAMTDKKLGIGRSIPEYVSSRADFKWDFAEATEHLSPFGILSRIASLHPGMVIPPRRDMNKQVDEFQAVGRGHGRQGGITDIQKPGAYRERGVMPPPLPGGPSHLPVGMNERNLPVARSPKKQMEMMVSVVEQVAARQVDKVLKDRPPPAPPIHPAPERRVSKPDFENDHIARRLAERIRRLGRDDRFRRGLLR